MNRVSNVTTLKLREAGTVQKPASSTTLFDVLLASSEIAKRALLRADWNSRPLIAEHGFSAVLSLEVDGKMRKILFDSGLDPHAATHNAEVLNLDLSVVPSKLVRLLP